MLVWNEDSINLKLKTLKLSKAFLVLIYKQFISQELLSFNLFQDCPKLKLL